MKEVNSKKIMGKNGIYLALTSFAIASVGYITGSDLNGNMIVNMLISVIGFAFMILFITMGQKEYRMANDGFMDLSSALKIGLGIALIGGIIAALYSMVLTEYIDPEFKQRMLDLQKQKMLEADPNMTQQQLDMAIQLTKKLSSPWITFSFSVIGSLFFGFIISLISGLVLKKEKPQTL